MWLHIQIELEIMWLPIQIEPLLSEVQVLFCFVFLAEIWKVYMVKTEFDI